MRRRAFTLLEILLVIAVLVGLLSLAVPLMRRPLSGAQLTESAEQLRGLLYMASAHAKQSGRRIELRFVGPVEPNLLAEQGQGEQNDASGESEPPGPGYTAIDARVESDPLGKPGVFEPLRVDWSHWQLNGRDLQVVRVDLAEPLPTSEETDQSPDSDGEAGPAILFAPDGRSQVGDAAILLSNKDGRRCRVLLRGETGIARIEKLQPVSADGESP